MRSMCLLTISIASWFAATTEPAQSQDRRINLFKEDQYATRRMEVIKKSGEKMSNVVGVQSFDPDSNAFSMQGVAGETTKVPVSDIQIINFEQAVVRQSPMAQAAAFEVTAKPGTMLKYEVPQNALRIDSGGLILPASSPVTSTPAPAAAKTSAETRNGKTSSVATDKIAEAKSLTYDPSSKSFRIEVQEVTYTKQVFGSSGVSGIRK
jgi:hypothetical protein